MLFLKKYHELKISIFFFTIVLINKNLNIEISKKKNIIFRYFKKVKNSEYNKLLHI